MLDKVFGTYMGIEFKEDAVVFSYVRNGFWGITLLSSSIFPLTSGETVSDDIREYIGKHGINVSKVFVSIPVRWAIIKFIDVPSMKGKGKGALANLMKFEIERHVPFEMEDIAYDFLIMNEKNMRYSVVFAAVQKEKIDFVKDYLGKLAIQPHAVTISAFAALNSIELSGASTGGWKDVVGIVRKSNVLGKKGETNISICFNKTSADVAVITDGLCSHLRSFIFNPSQPLDVFCIELSQYLSEVQSSLAPEHFDKMLISGEASSAEGLKDELSEKLKADTVAIKQVEKFSGSLKGAKINGLSPSLGACFAGLGIGTYRINLLPHKTDYGIVKIAPRATKLFLVLILILIAAIFTTEAVKQKKFLAAMDETLKANEPDIQAIEKLSSDTAVLRQQSNFLRDIDESEIALEILAELAGTVPKDVWITNLTYKAVELTDKKKAAGELILNGLADSSSPLILILEDSPYFEKVEFVGPINKTRDKEQFKLSAKIERPAGREGETE